MSKLFKTNNKIRKKHKKSLFDLGRTRFPKKLAQKLFATTVCIAMVLCTMPRGWGGYEVHAVDDVPTVTLTLGYAEGRYAYLDGVKDLDSHAGETVNIQVAVDGDAAASSTYRCTVNGKLFFNGSGALPGTIYGLRVPRGIASLEVMMTIDGVIGLAGSRAATIDFDKGWNDEYFFGGGYGSLKDGLTVLTDEDTTVRIGEVTKTTAKSEDWLGSSGAHFALDELPANLRESSLEILRPSGFVVDSEPLRRQQFTDWPEDRQNVLLEATLYEYGPRVQVLDAAGVLPQGATLSAERVSADHADHNFFVNFVDEKTDVEERYCYNLYLKNGDTTLSDLGGEVEVRFECPRHMDSQDTTVVHVSEGTDDRLTTRVETDEDGTVWICAKTSSFSPYVLEDALTERDVAENNRNTIITVTVVGVGIVLILALGVFLRRMKKKKLEN